MNKIKLTIPFLMLLLAFAKINAQDAWVVPEKDKLKLSYLKFEEELNAAGEQIYSNSCTSCHGTVGKANFTPMAPSPGDPASDRFQNQADGELFYKIKTGRGAMPKFEEILSEEDIWSLVSYFRSFNPKYVQKEIFTSNEPKLNFVVDLSFDDNIDKLVVKVKSDSLIIDSVNVTGFVKGQFGNLLLGKAKTNKKGIAYIDVDPDLPGDTAGNLIFLVKINKGISSKKIIDTITVTEPTKKLNAIEGRHLWSVGKKAPVWLIFIFWGTLAGIWSFIIYIVLGLRKIKKV